MTSARSAGAVRAAARWMAFQRPQIAWPQGPGLVEQSVGERNHVQSAEHAMRMRDGVQELPRPTARINSVRLSAAVKRASSGIERK